MRLTGSQHPERSASPGRCPSDKPARGRVPMTPKLRARACSPRWLRASWLPHLSPPGLLGARSEPRGVPSRHHRNASALFDGCLVLVTNRALEVADRLPEPLSNVGDAPC